MAESAELITIDEEFIKKVDTILDGDTDKVKLNVQVGLILALQSQSAKSINALVRHAKDQSARTDKNELLIAELRNSDIVGWVKKNLKTAITIVIIFIILIDVLVDHFSSVDGLLVVIMFFRKWLGI